MTDRSAWLQKQAEKVLDGRLVEWGEYRAAQVTGLGYSPISVEGRVQEDGRSRGSFLRPVPHVLCDACGYHGVARQRQRCPECGRPAKSVPGQSLKCTETRSGKPRKVIYDGASGHVLEVERAYHDMRNERWQRALIVRYVNCVTDDRAGELFGASRARMFEALAQARAFLMGYLKI